MAGLYVNYLYLVLDGIAVVLGLLFALKWGKRGLLATTLWLFVAGLVALSMGDAMATAGENFGVSTTLSGDANLGVESKDLAYIPAVILWIVAFFLPVKFAFVDAKRAPPAPPPEEGGAGGQDGAQKLPETQEVATPGTEQKKEDAGTPPPPPPAP